MRKKHAVIIVKREVEGKQRKIPFVGTLSGLRNPKDESQVEFFSWTRQGEWKRLYIPLDEIYSMATFLAEEYSDAGSGI